ncbi:MAG: sialidase family protein [Planctomycetota bacterium]
MADSDLRLIVVWTDSIASDSAEGAKSATALFDDPRVRQFHDHQRLVGQRFANHIDMPSMREVAEARGASTDTLEQRFQKSYVAGPAAVFDTVFFFPPGVEWGDAPPTPSGWVTQLDPTTFELNGERFRWGEEMGNEMGRIARGLLSASGAPAAAPPLVSARRIWSEAPHCAFGDLVRFGDRFFATFREASAHVHGTDGKVRILASDDGERWESLALLEDEGFDLRDPKLSIMPDGRLMMTCGGSDYSDGLLEWHTRVAYSADGTTWTAPRRVRGIPTNNWFFRLTWHDGVGYAMPNISGADPATGRAITSDRRIALFRTTDGMNYERAGDDLPLPSGACEASLAFDDEGVLTAVLRNAEGDSDHGFLVRAAAPYTDFAVHRIEHGLGGPNLLRLPGGGLLVGTREWPHDRPAEREGMATVFLRLHDDGTFERAFEVPSGGDTGYPGMQLHGDELVVNYYSSHEGSAAMYVARVPLSEL